MDKTIQMKADEADGLENNQRKKWPAAPTEMAEIANRFRERFVITYRYYYND